jgi:hypothetical protein
MPRGGPQLEFGVAIDPHLQQRIVAPIMQFDAREALSVAAVQAFGQSQDGGKRPHDASPLAGQIAVLLVSGLRRGAAMVPGHERDRVDLLGLESPQISVLDEVIRVLVMALVADVHADVVQKGGVFEPLPLAVGQRVHRARLIENRD